MRAGRFLTFAFISVAAAATAQPAAAQELSSRLSQPLFAPANLVGTRYASVVAAFDQDVPGVTKTEVPPPAPRHTGFVAFVRTTGSDFVAFPKRPSTWASA